MQPTPKIFLVTDNRLYEGIIRKYLAEMHCQLVVMSSGPEVVMQAEASQPDLVLLQAQLKQLTGFEVCRKLQSSSLNRRLPVIIFSTDEESRLTARLSGASGFLKIPFHAGELLTQIEKALDQHYTVLVVDDSPFVHQVMRETLDPDVYKLEEAMNGKEGLEILEKTRPDLIISDIEMPVMNGYEFCTAIKSNPKWSSIPILMQSSLNTGLDIDRGFASGADDYITKPIVPDELLSRINLLLHHDRSYRPETILVVDDSAMIRTMLGQGLGQQGFSVILAVNGEDALRQLQSQEISLLLTDYEMPSMDGMELVHRARAISGLEDLPIVMLTSRESKSDRTKGRIAGVTEYLSKPFAVDKLVVIVERLLTGRRLQREKNAMRLYLSDAAADHATEMAALKSDQWSSMRAREQTLTILFTDIAGFTPMCEKLSAVEVIELLNQYFDILVRVLKKHDAVVDKFIGDAILALFAGTEAGSLQAVRAAREMMADLQAFNRSVPTPINMRIGINTGKVMMGDLGSRFHRREFTVIGDAVNIAQRVESQAPVNRILISDHTYQLVKNRIRVHTQKPITLKGKSEALLTHVLEEVLP